MIVKDWGIGRELLELSDLIDDVPNVEGITIKPLDERVRVKRFDDTRKVIQGSSAGLAAIRFWIVVDRGEKEYRSQNHRDRYIAVGVGVGEDIQDVESESQGKALPGVYDDSFSASKVSAELTAICRIMED
jgi:hypothetical protein